MHLFGPYSLNASVRSLISPSVYSASILCHNHLSPIRSRMGLSQIFQEKKLRDLYIFTTYNYYSIR